MYKNYRLQVIEALLVAGMAMIIVIVAFNQAEDKIEQLVKENLEQRLNYTVRQCYILEGKYPPQISYLKDYYGIKMNPTKYKIDYSLKGMYEPPSITICSIEEE